MACRVRGRSARPDEDDICGSGFAITAYTVSEELGGDARWRSFAKDWRDAVSS